MMTLTNVLVPTDFAPPSLQAVALARTLAETFHATLHVLHVLPDPDTQLSSLVEVDVAAVRHGWEYEARRRLTEITSQYGTVEVATRVGDPAVEIIRYARECDVDRIVMGTHGRGPIGHMLWGSVAESVVRDAPCPVLIVPHPRHAFDASPRDRLSEPVAMATH